VGASVERPESYRAVTADLFPHRDTLLSRWRYAVEPLVDTTLARHPVTAAQAGSIFEICVGLDLSGTAPYRDALSMLPDGAAERLLVAAGCRPIDASPEYLDGWVRLGSAPQNMGEMVVGAWHVVLVYDLLHAKPHADRAWFADFADDALRGPAPPGVEDMVMDLWAAYTQRGRALLCDLGQPVVTRPIWHRHATGDLILGRTLVDIKATTDPVNDLDTSLLQVLRYVLFDRADAYRIAEIGLYFGYQAVLVTCPLVEELSTLTGDPSARLSSLREQFARRTGLAGRSVVDGEDEE
jgi:hypothetical protein